MAWSFPQQAVTKRLFDGGLDACECRIQLRAETLDDRNDRDRDAGGNEAVFDRSRSRFISQEPCNGTHVRRPGTRKGWTGRIQVFLKHVREKTERLLLVIHDGDVISPARRRFNVLLEPGSIVDARKRVLVRVGGLTKGQGCGAKTKGCGTSPQPSLKAKSSGEGPELPQVVPDDALT
jgi:hypothetical protein